MRWLAWFDERKVVLILLVLGNVVLLTLLIIDNTNLPDKIVELIAGGIGSLSTAIGMAIQAVFRQDRPPPPPS